MDGELALEERSTLGVILRAAQLVLTQQGRGGDADPVLDELIACCWAFAYLTNQPPREVALQLSSAPEIEHVPDMLAGLISELVGSFGDNSGTD